MTCPFCYFCTVEIGLGSVFQQKLHEFEVFFSDSDDQRILNIDDTLHTVTILVERVPRKVLPEISWEMFAVDAA